MAAHGEPPRTPVPKHGKPLTLLLAEALALLDRRINSGLPVLRSLMRGVGMAMLLTVVAVLPAIHHALLVSMASKALARVANAHPEDTWPAHIAAPVLLVAGVGAFLEGEARRAGHILVRKGIGRSRKTWAALLVGGVVGAAFAFHLVLYAVRPIA